MPFVIALIVIVVLLLYSALYVVPQQQAYSIERFGKFHKGQ